MTYTWNINCHKWRNVGLMGIWILATIGLGSGIYALINNSSFEKEYSACWTHDYTSIYDGVHHTKECVSDGWILLIGQWFVALLANGGNVFYMWYLINKRLKILEVKCSNNNKSGYYKWTDGFGNNHLINTNQTETLPKTSNDIITERSSE